MQRESRRTSPIWSIPKDQLIELVASKDSISDVLRHFGYKPYTGMHRVLNQRCKEDGIDLTDIKIRGVQKIKRSGAKAFPLEDILVEDSTYTHTSHLKARLIKEEILEERCEKCGLGPEWQAERLSLVLDHINGKNNDNRKENLRLLCPNCNSQTDTFSGKNSQNGWKKLKESPSLLRNIPRYCKICGEEFFSAQTEAIYCSQECVHEDQKRCEWPPKEELKELLKENSWRALGRRYNVSDNAVRNWARQYGLI